MGHGPKFKVPDLPPDRPKVPEVAAMIRAYYELPGNGVGGRLHVVLDDNNMERHFIADSLEDCLKAGDEAGAAICRAMLAMTPSQKRRLRW